MKQNIKKILPWVIGIITLLIVFVFIVDTFIMPWYVENEEIVVPNVVGIHKDESSKILTENMLQAVVEGPRYNERFPIDHVIYQKPEAGSIVKKNRRVFIYFSGGQQLTKMPYLLDKTLRDASITLSALNLVIDEVIEEKSEFKAGTIIEQEPTEGTEVEKGAKVNLKVSLGPKIGMVRVPDLIGKSYKEAVEIIESNSLIVGELNYQRSNNLLPNTIFQQYPTVNKLINVGESIDLFITKSKN